jgi:hypothetical protein
VDAERLRAPRARLQPAPASLDHAVSLMENSELVAETLGEQVFNYVLLNKRQEWKEYRAQVTPYELTQPEDALSWHRCHVRVAVLTANSPPRVRSPREAPSPSAEVSADERAMQTLLPHVLDRGGSGSGARRSERPAGALAGRDVAPILDGPTRCDSGSSVSVRPTDSASSSCATRASSPSSPRRCALHCQRSLSHACWRPSPASRERQPGTPCASATGATLARPHGVRSRADDPVGDR